MRCDMLQKSLLSDPIQLQALTLPSPCCPTEGGGGGWAERDVPAEGVPQVRRVHEHTVPDPARGTGNGGVKAINVAPAFLEFKSNPVTLSSGWTLGSPGRSGKTHTHTHTPGPRPLSDQVNLNQYFFKAPGRL